MLGHHVHQHRGGGGGLLLSEVHPEEVAVALLESKSFHLLDLLGELHVLAHLGEAEPGLGEGRARIADLGEDLIPGELQLPLDLDLLGTQGANRSPRAAPLKRDVQRQEHIESERALVVRVRDGVAGVLGPGDANIEARQRVVLCLSGLKVDVLKGELQGSDLRPPPQREFPIVGPGDPRRVHRGGELLREAGVIGDPRRA